MPRRAAVHLAFGVFALMFCVQLARFGGLAPDPRALAGAAGALACLALVHYTASALCERTPAWLLAGGFLASCAPFAFHAARAPAAPAAALFALATLLALHRGHPRAAACAAAALVALRPEAVLVVPALVLHALWTRHRDGETPPWLRPFALGALLLTAAVVAVLGPRFPPPGPGAAAYLHDVMAAYLPVPVLVLAVAALSFRAAEGALFTTPPAVGLAVLAFTCATGGDPAPLYRPFMTLVPLAFLLAAAGLETVLGLIGSLLSSLDRGAAVAGLLICALQLNHVPADQAQAVLSSREQKLPRNSWNSPP